MWFRTAVILNVRKQMESRIIELTIWFFYHAGRYFLKKILYKRKSIW